ncbi:MAG: hypothetical protein KF884_02865 [Fimbriimonadaceae bacterium]|nr:hypothetical protein [Fimbriimonadaceae bacterium]QYK59038.1 MAG: hypothetical protein KF884_02865 [Fimbriimonadaceae bacterium]
MKVENSQIQKLVQSRPQGSQPGARPTDFQGLLTDRLKVSSHAQTRIQSREIQLDQAAWERVMAGVDKAAQKGAKESLVMVDDVALVVSVKNRTVITAVDRERLKESVFTNIDSAVIV